MKSTLKLGAYDKSISSRELASYNIPIVTIQRLLSNDTAADVILNLLIKKYETLPDDYRLVGFDGSPVSKSAIIPISTVEQQIEKNCS